MMIVIDKIAGFKVVRRSHCRMRSRDTKTPSYSQNSNNEAKQHMVGLCYDPKYKAKLLAASLTHYKAQPNYKLDWLNFQLRFRNLDCKGDRQAKNRCVWNVTWTLYRTNVSTHQTILNIQTRLSTKVSQSFLRYFGHIVRKDDSIERLMVEGRRPRGRSPKQWVDQKKSLDWGHLAWSSSHGPETNG